MRKNSFFYYHYYFLYRFFLIILISFYGLFSSISTLWNGTYGTSGQPYTLLNNDRIQLCKFITTNPGDTLEVNMAGNILGDTTSATLSFVVPDETNVITINITEDTFLKGCFFETIPLLISIEGRGTVVWNIQQGATLHFGDFGCPTYFLVSCNATQSPKAVFQILDMPDSQLNSLIVVDQDSCIGFVSNVSPSDNSVPEGTIIFNGNRPGNSNLGVLGIKINNGGSIFSEVVNYSGGLVNGFLIPENVQFVQLWQNNNLQYAKSNIFYSNNRDIRNKSQHSLHNQIMYSDSRDLISEYSTIIIENSNATQYLWRKDILFDEFSVSNNILRNIPRPGFIVGLNGSFIVDDASSVIYIVRKENEVPLQIEEKIFNNNLSHLRKVQNYSALCLEGVFGILDNGLNESQDLGLKPLLFKSYTPTIKFNGTSALYFGSSIVNNAYVLNPCAINSGLTIHTNQGSDFTISHPDYWASLDPIGAIALINHGEAAIIGNDNYKSCIGILTNNFTFSGNNNIPNQAGSLFPELLFDNKFLGKTCFVNDGDLALTNIYLLHTDNINKVDVKNDVYSPSPFWMSGDYQEMLEFLREQYVIPFFNLRNTGLNPATIEDRYYRRPKLYLWNSNIGIVNNSGLCFEGQDLWIENVSLLLNNISSFNDISLLNINNVILYKDGLQNTKNIILGSQHDGSLYYNVTVDKSAHLDIFSKMRNSNNIQLLTLQMMSDQADNSFYNELAKPLDLREGFLFHNKYFNEVSGRIYLQEQSNITLGGNNDLICSLKLINETGIGGYFNGKNPIFGLENGFNICTIKARGFLDIDEVDSQKTNLITTPILYDRASSIEYNYGDQNEAIKNSYFNISGVTAYDSSLSFNNLIGDIILVPQNTYIPTVNLDAKIIQNYSFNDSIASIDPVDVNSLNALNFINVPNVRGITDCVTISGTNRISILRCQEGTIRSLNFVNSPINFNETRRVALLLQSGDKNKPSTIGVGKYTSSDYVPVEFGPRGIMTYFQGSAQYVIHNDIIINGSQQFISIPLVTIVEKNNIKSYSNPIFNRDNPNKLKFTSVNKSKIIVKSGQCLDLDYLQSGDTIEFNNIELVFEPGSLFNLGSQGVNVLFTGDSKVTVLPCQKVDNINYGYSDMVEWTGIGSISFNNNSLLSITDNSYFIILSKTANSDTDLKLNFNDSSVCDIGTGGFCGASFMIGNYLLNERMINCSIILNGANVSFNINQGSFFGVGAFVKNKTRLSGFFDWRIFPAFNLNYFNFDLIRGTFNCNASLNFDDNFSLIALGYDDTGIYNFKINKLRKEAISSQSIFDNIFPSSRLLGGCYVVLLDESAPLEGIKIANEINEGLSLDGTYYFAFLESGEIRNYYKSAINLINGTSNDFFTMLKLARDFSSYSLKTSGASRSLGLTNSNLFKEDFMSYEYIYNVFAKQGYIV